MVKWLGLRARGHRFESGQDFLGSLGADIRGDRGLMSDAFRVFQPLTEFSWACEGRFYAVWDHC